MASIKKPLVIWRFTDGKAGHEKQTQALIEGITAQRTVKVEEIDIRTTRGCRRALLQGRWPQLHSRNHPDIALGAGHGTHLFVLAAKRAFAAKAVVIMNPSLPAALFDAVITPAHDGFKPAGNRLVSVTALAPAVASDPQAGQGLILLGGTNAHFHWPEAAVINMLEQLLDSKPQSHWQVSNSRRTPASTTDAVAHLCDGRANARFIDVNNSPSNWLAQQLETSDEIWISADSASMVAEALNTSARVGVISLPAKNPAKPNKIARSLTLLRSLEPLGELSTNGLQPAAARSAGANHQLSVGQELLTLLQL